LICGSSIDYASMKAAYRFFDNDKVTTQKILEPHYLATMNRCEKLAFTLALHDSSTFNFTTHRAKKGLGTVGKYNNAIDTENSKGFYTHPTLAVAPNGTPLGLLNNYFWNRHPKTEEEKKIPHRKRTVNYNDRWTNAIEDIEDRTDGKLNILHVADREADFNDFFIAIREKSQHFLVRSRNNRNIYNSTLHLHDYIKTLPVSGSFKQIIRNKLGRNNEKIDLHSLIDNQTTKSRIEAELNIQFCHVDLVLEKGYGGTINASMPVSVVRVFEETKEFKNDSDKIDWILITSIVVDSAEEAKYISQFYSYRWRIEEYFKILKSGFLLESSRYETYERTTNFIALMMIIAWRIFYITHMKRTNPEAPCTLILSDIEWKALHCKVYKTKAIPEEIPNIEKVVTWLAKLGGCHSVKKNADPGVISVWRGYRRLFDLASMFDLFNTS